ncbi:hypothetical protein B9Z19DRAFT_1147416 [Tuber borchii]|uniref:Uncharacterized protein n=1 Tax=Tuber borchii TaxID=42251 RepID=A0A2T6ZNF6_TUBBO|nr:hypothetical protein B9Z19DRAFT_1147416 [Tuber borchii]
MSRIFIKRLYPTPLLAVKLSPRFRFPTRSFNSFANIYNSTTPGTAQNDEGSGNVNPRKLWTTQNEDHLIGRIYKLEDHAHKSDDRFINSVKDSAALKVDVTKAIGEISSKIEVRFSKMDATMAKLSAEHKSDMAKLSTDMAKIYFAHKSDMAKLSAEHKSDIAKLSVEHKSDMAKLSTDIGKNYAEHKSDMGKIYVELKTDIGELKSKVLTYFAAKYPDEFISFAKSILARFPPPPPSESNPF